MGNFKERTGEKGALIMARAFSNRNVLSAQFEQLPFDGQWLRSIGRPELSGCWIVYGGSGSGKTSFLMQLAKYMTRFGKVAYNSLEQGLSLSLKTAWQRVDMGEAGNEIILLDKESLEDLNKRLMKPKSPKVIIIDSMHYWLGYRLSDHISLINRYRDKLFIYVAHERSGMPDGKLAIKIRYDANVKIRVEGYKAFVTSRYAVPEKDEGSEPFIIWQEGAERYWGDAGTASLT